MMHSLKEKAINGVIWNAISNFSSLGIEFIVGIILARLLTPKEFGLIGTITVVIVLSEVFVNSGFNQAIIRKQNCTQKDYSTAFFFNFIIATLFFLLLFFTAKPISIFFNNQELRPLIQVLGFGLIISAFTLVQKATLTKRIDFKLQTKINLISSIVSGIIGIVLAATGFGVWSLVVRSLVHKGLQSILLWIWNSWKPDWLFSWESFKELFGFGSKLLLSGLIGTFLNNINYLIIAKYFSAQDLGYFTRAEMFKNLPAQSVTSVVTTVGYPVLATLQNDHVQMKSVFRKMFKNTFFIVVILLAGLAAISRTLIITLLGEQWLPSVELLQLLCVVGVMAPLNSMNVNVLNVVGRSDLYLKLQFILQVLAIPNIFIGVFFGIKALIIGMIGISFFGYFIFTQESNKILNYSLREQLKDIYPALTASSTMGISVFVIDLISNLPDLYTLIIQVVAGIVIIIISGEVFKMREYTYLKLLLIEMTINK